MNEFLKTSLFIDVETVAIKNTFDELDDDQKKLWEKQCKQSYSHLEKAEDGNPIAPSVLWKQKAAMHPEFAQVVSICMGYFVVDEATSKLTLRIKPLFGSKESDMLSQFATILARQNNGVPAFQRLVAHNGKRFDFPFLFRRFLINKLSTPDLLNLIGKKPWEVPNLDTMELWAAGGIGYPSLDLLCKTLGLPMKTGLDGSQVHDTFYAEKDAEKIAKYCAGDVAALARLFLRIYEVDKEVEVVVL